MKSVILAQKITQIQKRNEASEDKKNEEKQRSTYKPLESTLRMVNPFSVFKVYMTGMIKDGDHTIYPAVSCINYIKTITEVQHDKKNKLVRLSMENESSLNQINWEELIDRIESKGDYYTNEWARVLESYFESIDEMKKFSSKFIKSPELYDFGMSKKEFNDLKALIQKNYMSMYIKGTLSQNEPYSIEFNQNMIQYLGYNLDEFCSDILAYGIPEIYPNSQRKYADKLRDLLKNLSEDKFDGTPAQIDIELLRANFSTTFVRETIFTFRSLDENNNFNYELLIQYEHLSTPPPNKKKTFVTEFTSLGKFGYQAPEIEKEREEFLAKFYNIKKEKPRDESKVCKIRFLDSNE